MAGAKRQHRGFLPLAARDEQLAVSGAIARDRSRLRYSSSAAEGCSAAPPISTIQSNPLVKLDNNTPPDLSIWRRAVYPFGISCEGFTFLLWKPRQASINYTRQKEL